MVTNTFTVAYGLKSYAAGALYRTYPGGWAVWLEAVGAPGGYELVYSSARRPSGDEIDELLVVEDEDAAGGSRSPLDGLGAFIKGFRAM